MAGGPGFSGEPLHGDIRAESVYLNVRQEFETIGSFSIVTAETPQMNIRGGGSRQHRRVLCASQLPDLFGKPIAYSDTYVTASGQKTFVYARHREQPRTFFLKLDYFFEENERDFPELAAREFVCWMNYRGRALDVEVPRPFSVHLPLDVEQMEDIAGIEFVRIGLPFGDLSVEFGEPTPEPMNEFDYVRQRTLNKFVEAPLFGFDATTSTVLASFFSRIHWANESVPPKILERMLEQFASTAIPA